MDLRTQEHKAQVARRATGNRHKAKGVGW